MKITVVMGFFLPIPPVAGGATEKSWDGLVREFAARGNDVSVISRRWPGFPDREFSNGIRHIRLRGYSHASRLAVNLWHDFIWSWRVWRNLPAADITVVNCLCLPVWLGWLRRKSGRLVVMPGRIPKGQYRFYRRIDRVLAVSSAVHAAVRSENPALGAVSKITGYPIAWSALAAPRNRSPDAPATIGYIGRLHREKGLDLFVAAIASLARRPGLPAFRVVLCGPSDVARGGSGEAYAASLERALAKEISSEHLSLRAPVFDENALADVYRELDIFCYPSLALRGETFGVAVAEAMAAGAVPVVSQLACFSDFVRPGLNGETFDHTAPDAAERLAAMLATLLTDSARRAQLSRTAQADVRGYNFPEFASRLLEDFSALK